MRWVLALMVGLLLTLMVPSAGAGGGGRVSQSSSRAALARKANAICATAQAKARALKVPSSFVSNPAAASAYLDKLFPITDKETRALKALTPAPGAARDWRTFVGAQVTADQLLLTLKQKADARDPGFLSDLQKVQPIGRRVARAATKIGATICAKG